MIDAFLAADGLALVAFVAGTAIGLGVGWVLRGWRAADADADAAREQSDEGLDRRANAPERAYTLPTPRTRAARVRTTSAAAVHPIDLEDDENIGPTILLIDDRLEMLGIHAAYLRKHGYRTLLAEDGTTGLHLARAYRPTLIVLDHSMPDRTGVEVARELKADPATASIPILLLTALSYGAVGAAAMEAGCAAFLPKPIEPSRLLREIQAHTPPRH